MENLGVDYKLLIAQLINFGLFFFIFKKFIAAPFMEFLRKEKNNEAEKQKALAMIQSQQERLAQEEKEYRAKARREVEAVMKEAKADAEKVRQDLVKDAEKEADAIVERAKKQIEEEKQEVYKELKNKTGELSVMMINKALNNYLDEDAQKRLTEHILNNLTKEVDYR